MRINSLERASRLLSLIENIPKVENSNLSIRVRGNLDNLPLKSKNPNRIYYGTSWNEWNLDLFEQVVESPSAYYILIQEDHKLKVSEEKLKFLLREISNFSIDYLPLSFHPQYKNFVKELSRNCSHGQIEKEFMYWDLSRRCFNNVLPGNRVYPLNLIGVYKKELILRLLRRIRPLYKEFSIQTPYNFERNPRESWYLPIRWAYPQGEIFACIDDDHGIQGYSLISRGEYDSNVKRVVEHHNIKSNTSSIKFNRIKKFLLPRLGTKLPAFLRNLKYSVEFLRNLPRRRSVVKKLLLKL